MPLQLPIAPETPPTLPRLVNGDRLDRREFHRRYEGDRTICQAELIEGVVYLTPRVCVRSHGEPHGLLVVWLGWYSFTQPGLILADTATLMLDDRNEVQPDAMLFDPASGRATITEEDYLAGAPELIVEIAASSTAQDLHDKKRAYERNGVLEYLVWSTRDRRLDWFVLAGDRYVDLPPDEAGIFRSRVFPGLWLDGTALLTGDLMRLQAIAQAGLRAIAEQASE